MYHLSALVRTGSVISGQRATTAFTISDGVLTTVYVRGRHGAALNEARWPEIARFILFGPDGGQAETNPARRNPVVVMLGYLCPVVWVALLAVAVAPLLILLEALGLTLLPITSTSTWQSLVDQASLLPAWGSAIALAGWGGILRIILTKV